MVCMSPPSVPHIRGGKLKRFIVFLKLMTLIEILKSEKGDLDKIESGCKTF